MDLRAQLLRLVAPIEIGDELAPDVRLCDASIELGLRLRVQVEAMRVDVEIQPWVEGLPHAARTASFMLSYRTGEGARSVQPAIGMRAVQAVARHVARNEAAVVGAIASDDRGASPKLAEVEVARALEPADGFDTLSPYVGCVIGCRFCYAQSRLVPLRRLLGHADVPWGSWVDVRTSIAQVLARELVGRPPRPIKLCPIVSDPYHAIERRYRLTRACLDAIAAATPAPPVLVLTRSDLVLDDLDRLAAMAAWVGVSLPTIDDAVARRFEPRAATPSRRVEVLRALAHAGVRTIAVVQPMLPGPIDPLADALAAHAGSVSLDVLRGIESATEEFGDPEHAMAREDGWQRERLHALREALVERGVVLWRGELPPELEDPPELEGSP